MIAAVLKVISTNLPFRAMSIIASVTLALSLGHGLGTPALAGGAHSLFIMDANTGATLTDQAANEQRYPASLTKMMTLYLAFDAIEHGRAAMRTKIKISQAAANAAPSKLDLAPGDEIALEDAILALITKSANDIAIAVAEHIGGSEANFAKLMTAKARELGMKSTTFQNASGLPNSNQHTTARDMATLGVRLYDDFPRYFPLFATRSYNYNGATFRNHNTLMLQMPGINGIKTGYTHASGFNLVSSLQLDGKHVIGAIFGGETAGSRNAHMRVALTRAMAKASTAKTRKPVLVARAEADAKAKAKATSETKAAHEAKRPRPAPTPVATASAADVAAPVQQQVQQQVQQPSAFKVDVAKVRPVNVADATPKVAIPQAPAQQAPAVQATVPEATVPQATVPQATVPKVAPFAQASQASTVAGFAASGHASAPAPAASLPAPAPAVPDPAKSTRQPSSFESQMAGLAQNIQPRQPQAAPQPRTVALPVEAARPPSSLNAQLAQLTQGAPAPMAQPSYRLKGPDAPVQAAASAPVVKGFDIQIGAYASAAEADRQLTQVQAQAPILAGYAPKRQSVKLGDKMLYRARFTGFDQSSAQAMCAELIRQSINCLALKSD